MTRQFIIVNHARRDLSGHHFHAALPVAQSLREAGWRPVMATHVDCRPGEVPVWLEVHPVFCTDHAMMEPVAEPPDLAGAQIDPYARAAVSIASVRSGRASVREFLAGRFASIAPAPSAAVQGRRVSSRLHDCGRWFYHKAIWASRRGAFYLSPPFLYKGCRFMVGAAARHCVPPLFKREHHQRLRTRIGPITAKLRLICKGLNFEGGGPAVLAGLGHPVERPLIELALGELAPLGSTLEIEHALLFKRDLERLLAITGADADDHVLMPSALARELLAVHLVARRLGERRCPTFHLQFRDSVFGREPEARKLERSSFAGVVQAWFSLHARWGPSNRMRLYAGTDQRCDDLKRLSGLSFEVLPAPFRGGAAEDCLGNERSGSS
ncbi:MAG TPA: hypothetical protein VND64_03295 [Pirellulales bacterium]|nr:hypothetical protein [Pirellulales bacterium]